MNRSKPRLWLLLVPLVGAFVIADSESAEAQQVTVSVTNERGTAVEVVWIPNQGQQRSIGTIDPNGQMTVNTSPNVQLQFKVRGTVIATHNVGRQNSQFVVQADRGNTQPGGQQQPPNQQNANKTVWSTTPADGNLFTGVFRKNPDGTWTLRDSQGTVIEQYTETQVTAQGTLLSSSQVEGTMVYLTAQSGSYLSANNPQWQQFAVGGWIAPQQVVPGFDPPMGNGGGNPIVGSGQKTYWLGQPVPGQPTKMSFRVPVPQEVVTKLIQKNDVPGANYQTFERPINGTRYRFHKNKIAWSNQSVNQGNFSFSDGFSFGNTWITINRGNNFPQFLTGLRTIQQPWDPMNPGNGVFVAEPIVMELNGQSPPNFQVTFGGPFNTAASGSEHRRATGMNPQVVGVPVGQSLVIGWNEVVNGKVQFARIARFHPNGQSWQQVWSKRLPLERFAGLTTDGQNVYAVSTRAEDLDQAQNPNQSILNHRNNHVQMTKFDGSGNLLWTKDLDSPTYLGVQETGGWPGVGRALYSPMVAGTCQIAYGGGQIVVAIATNTVPDPNIGGRRHQRAVFFTVNADGSGSQSATEASSRHSFDQRVLWDGQDFVIMDLADSGWYMPAAGITLRKARPVNGQRTDFLPNNLWEGVYAFAAHGSSNGGNYSYISMGSLAAGNNGYGLLFSSERSQTVSLSNPFDAPVPRPRNLAFVHVRKNFETVTDAGPDPFNNQQPKPGNVVRGADGTTSINITGNVVDSQGADSGVMTRHDKPGFTFNQKGVIWLTNYSSGVTVERPKLVRLANGNFVAMWEEWSYSGTGQNLKHQSTKAMLLSEYGQTLGQPRTINARLNPCGADREFPMANQASWIEGSPNSGGFILHQIDSNLNLRSTILPL